MRFFAAIDALPSLESMKFPVFSLLPGNFGLFQLTSSQHVLRATENWEQFWRCFISAC